MKRLKCGLILALASLISTHAFAEVLSDLLIDGQDWELVAEGFTFTEGPAADLAGRLYFTDPSRNIIYRLNDAGKSEIFVGQSHGTNGMMFGPDGRLYACQNSKKQIVAYDSAGKDTVIATGVTSNDIVVNRAGGIYFTDPPEKKVWYISPQGEKRVVDEGLGYANGLILSPDQKTLVVADMKSINLFAYAVQPDGSLADKRPLYTLKIPADKKVLGADGITVDSEGRIYSTSYLGLQVFSPDGRLIGVIEKPHNGWLANVKFAGPDLDTVYVTSMNKVFKRKLNARGVRYFDVPSKK